MTRNRLIEILAHKEHASWNRWMNWLYQNGTWNPDGSFTITAEKAQRWKQLAQMDYIHLDEQTKQYDRDEVMQIMPNIDSYAAQRPIPEDPNAGA